MNCNVFRRFVILMSALAATSVVAAADAGGAPPRPTILLVHGAFADSWSWNGAVAKLSAKGYRVVSAANPLRSVAGDARYVASVIDSVKGPVVVVGHSYGGTVVTNAAADKPQVKALVYVAAFAPDRGKASADLAGKFPGSTLGDALAPPVPLPEGGVDLYIRRDRFAQQFAADVKPADASLMAVARRPIAEAALKEATQAVAWKQVPSCSIYGTADKNIPEEGLGYMAKRAGSRKSVVVKDASHVVMVSHPDQVAALIEEAAATAK